MNGVEVLRIVDAIHRDKNIDKEIVFEGIEQAILSAARKHYGEEEDLAVGIDRETGEPALRLQGELLDPDVLGDLLGRISAQTAKQVMIQKIREAERDALFEEFSELKSQIVTGVVTRVDGGAATVNLGKVEGILPRGEQIPGESYRVGERVRSIVLDVRKVGSRVKIILSRTHADLVRRLFELEIPEVAEHVIEVRSLAREAGYRSKVAVSTFDSKIDCVGACVGVRGSRIKSVVDELAGERIDIVRWNDSLQVLVPNGLQPAEVEDVILCPMLGKVIVLVQDDQLSLAIGKKGQNVRLASKLVGWDIHIMNQEKLDEQLDRSVADFASVPEVSEELAENLVAQGFFTFDDLSVIEPDQLAELGGLTQEQCDAIIAYADAESIRVEEEERRAAQEARAARLQAAKEPAAKDAVAEAGDEQIETAVEEIAASADEGETNAGEEPASTDTEEIAETGEGELEQVDTPGTEPELSTATKTATEDETTIEDETAGDSAGDQQSPETTADVDAAESDTASESETVAEEHTTDDEAGDQQPSETTDAVDAGGLQTGSAGTGDDELPDESLHKAEASAAEE